MRSVFFTFLLGVVSVNAMHRLPSSGDLGALQLSQDELSELEKERKLTPVPHLNCYYCDKDEKNILEEYDIHPLTGKFALIKKEVTTPRFTIEKKTLQVIARHTIAQRPDAW